MKLQILKLSIFLILSGCSVSTFAQADNSVPNDKSSKKSVRVGQLDEIFPAGKIFAPGRVFIPNRIYIGEIPNYSQMTECAPTLENNAIENNVIVVNARSGDTIESLAKRYSVDAVEVAKLNGLFIRADFS